MERLKRILHKLLFPGTAVVFICVPAAAALLVYAFMYAGEDSPVSYIAYVFSAYALAIMCANVLPIFRRGSSWARKNALVSRYLAEPAYRVNVSLHSSLVINMLYSLLNAVYGVIYRSVWFGTLAAYYTFLAVLRFMLVRYAHRHGFGTNLAGEWRWYRICGAVLVAMTIAMAGVVILVLHEDGGFSYAGSLIYAMAAYTFYTVIMAVRNVIRYHRYHSPAMSAARAVSLAAALVSMLSLEIAMLTQFGGEEDGGFRTLMIMLTGAAVCFIVIGLGSYMIVRSTKALGEPGGKERQIEHGCE